LGGREGGNKTKGTANVGAGLALPSKGAASSASTAENEKSHHLGISLCHGF